MSEPKKVTALGGIFFKCQNPEATREWYNKHLGFNTDQYGTSFEWRHADDPDKKGYTVWSPFKNETSYFSPSGREFMINLRVENLDWLLEELKKEGIEQVGDTEVYDYGKFAWILDPNGVKLELWQPVDEVYEKAIDEVTK